MCRIAYKVDGEPEHSFRVEFPDHREEAVRTWIANLEELVTRERVGLRVGKEARETYIPRESSLNMAVDFR